MSSFVAMPRIGHLQQLYHMFSYLKVHHNSRLVLDPSYPHIDEKAFERRNWKDFHGDVKEVLPDHFPRPFEKELLIRAFVDADFAGESLTRRSRTGFLIMLNSSPIYWLSKKQTAVETSSSFGSKFLAMKACCEYLRGFEIQDSNDGNTN